MGNCYAPKKKLESNLKLSESLTDKIRRSSFNLNQLKKIKFKNNTEILNGYIIKEKLGSGTFSKVYLAINKKYNKEVALKIIKKKNFTSTNTIKKILVEKEILKKIHHQNILKLNRTMQSQSRIFYELEYVPNGNLLEVIKNVHNLRLKEIKQILAQIILALLHLHENNIIYGDLKADNILFNKNGAVKLCDFNLSGTSSMLGETIHGTVAYIAPEILKKKMEFKSDFWALGVLTFLLIVKKYPFDSKTRSETFFNIMNRIIIQDFENLGFSEKKFILDLLNLDPKKRIGDNLKQFVNHAFFKGFDWKKIQKENVYFNYIDKIKKERDFFLIDESFEGNSNINIDDSRAKYYIDDFDFENSEDSSNFITSSNQSIKETG